MARHISDLRQYGPPAVCLNWRTLTLRQAFWVGKFFRERLAILEDFMKRLTGVCLLLIVTSAFSGWAGAANSSLFCEGISTTIMDLSLGTLPFPTGTTITDQFQTEGVTFSTDNTGLPPEFQRGGSQDNVIQQGSLTNLFRLDFDRGTPIVAASVSIQDANVNGQVHTLAAFDHSGNILDRVTFTEPPLQPSFPDRITLKVSSCKGIASIVEIEDPPAAERVERITFTHGQLIPQGQSKPPF